jgi:hypothetical protein
MKSIDITPTWEQWLNFTMAVALRSADPSKVLEAVSEDLKKMAALADLQVSSMSQETKNPQP